MYVQCLLVLIHLQEQDQHHYTDKSKSQYAHPLVACMWYFTSDIHHQHNVENSEPGQSLFDILVLGDTYHHHIQVC